jgi:hypothetical protein
LVIYKPTLGHGVSMKKILIIVSLISWSTCFAEPDVMKKEATPKIEKKRDCNCFDPTSDDFKKCMELKDEKVKLEEGIKSLSVSEGDVADCMMGKEQTQKNKDGCQDAIKKNNSHIVEKLQSHIKTVSLELNAYIEKCELSTAVVNQDRKTDPQKTTVIKDPNTEPEKSFTVHEAVEGR